MLMFFQRIFCLDEQEQLMDVELVFFVVVFFFCCCFFCNLCGREVCVPLIWYLE